MEQAYEITFFVVWKSTWKSLLGHNFRFGGGGGYVGFNAKILRAYFDTRKKIDLKLLNLTFNSVIKAKIGHFHRKI